MLRIKNKELVHQLIKGQGHFFRDPVPLAIFFDKTSKGFIIVYYEIEKADLYGNLEIDLLWTDGGWVHEKTATEYFIGSEDKILDKKTITTEEVKIEDSGWEEI